ncbi:MAG: Smr/MutS family protein [Bacilli bacterium]|nr:Smr/MutS family protein [Bacilli bacterium]
MLDKYLPKLDLHGLDRDYARILLREFIEDNRKLGNKTIEIIHGKGKGILKRAVHEELKINKLVESYKLDNFNDGCTVVILKK